jgi:dienelactone hydrolase
MDSNGAAPCPVCAHWSLWRRLQRRPSRWNRFRFPKTNGRCGPCCSGPTDKVRFPRLWGFTAVRVRMTVPATLQPIYRAWGERLAANGYAVVFPDSFGSRGAGPQCRLRERSIRARVERVGDANAARRWLQEQPWVKKDRISLVGWSHGGAAVLWTVRARVSAQDRSSDFRSAIAFYPGCRWPGERAWSARVPTLILIGRADDWTPASACETMVAGARGRSARVEIVTYPGAHHRFDHPNLPLSERTGLAFTADNSGKAHVGSDAAARQDSIKRVTAWLAR